MNIRHFIPICVYLNLCHGGEYAHATMDGRHVSNLSVPRNELLEALATAIAFAFQPKLPRECT